MSEEICKTCGRPILEDEGRYTLGEFQDPPVYQHYSCYAGQRAAFDRSVEDFDRAFARAKLLMDDIKRRQ